MRPRSIHHPSTFAEPRYAYRPFETLLVTAALTLTFVALLLVVSHPVATVGVVVATAGVRSIVSEARRRRRGRRAGGTRTVCIPMTDVCIET